VAEPPLVVLFPLDPSYVDYLAGKLQPFMKPGGVLLDSG
jgi:hypothetical protein